jgi:tetratricopeptide (TPR) repeat protein
MSRTSKAAAALVALLLATPPGAYAQIGRVAGIVTDEAGRPLKGATITAENPEHYPSTFTSSSDTRGRFAILGMRRGIWTFTIQAPGFETAVTRRDVVTLRPNPPLDVRMAKRAPAPPPSPLAGIDAEEIQRSIQSAESLASSGDFDGAILVYRTLLDKVPALTSIYLQIGALHERRNDTGAALAAYRKLVELEPANATAKAAIDRLGRS